MMSAWQRNGIVAAALLAFGAARLPYEDGLAGDLRRAGLTSPPIPVGALDKVDQTGWAVALGGLRTLVATFMNLRASGFFEENEWAKVDDTYNTIVDLVPHSDFYWENGSWYTGYCAASYYINDPDLPGLRRRQAWQASILKARAFLERGIRNNPDDWSLLAALGRLLSDDFKFPAFGNPDKTFAEAADAYRRAAATGKALGYVNRAEFIALARVPGQETAALALGRELYQDPHNRVPTVLTLILVLEAHADPALDTAARATGLFGTPEGAYKALTDHWWRVNDRMPVYGVAKALESLEATLGIPPEKSVFRRPLPPPRGPDDWFAR